MVTSRSLVTPTSNALLERALSTGDDKKREKSNRLRFYFGTGGLLASYLVAMVTVSIIAARQVG
mgnify:CR=1 FL=1